MGVRLFGCASIENWRTLNRNSSAKKIGQWKVLTLPCDIADNCSVQSEHCLSYVTQLALTHLESLCWVKLFLPSLFVYSNIILILFLYLQRRLIENFCSFSHSDNIYFLKFSQSIDAWSLSQKQKCGFGLLHVLFTSLKKRINFYNWDQI